MSDKFCPHCGASSAGLSGYVCGWVSGPKSERMISLRHAVNAIEARAKEYEPCVSGSFIDGARFGLREALTALAVMDILERAEENQ